MTEGVGNGAVDRLAADVAFMNSKIMEALGVEASDGAVTIPAGTPYALCTERDLDGTLKTLEARQAALELAAARAKRKSAERRARPRPLGRAGLTRRHRKARVHLLYERIANRELWDFKDANFLRMEMLRPSLTRRILTPMEPLTDKDKEELLRNGLGPPGVLEIDDKTRAGGMAGLGAGPEDVTREGE